MRRPLEAIDRGAFPELDEQLRRYLRDVYDHVRPVDEMVNSQRELLTSVLEQTWRRSACARTRW